MVVTRIKREKIIWTILMYKQITWFNYQNQYQFGCIMIICYLVVSDDTFAKCIQTASTQNRGGNADTADWQIATTYHQTLQEKICFKGSNLNVSPRY